MLCLRNTFGNRVKDMEDTGMNTISRTRKRLLVLSAVSIIVGWFFFSSVRAQEKEVLTAGCKTAYFLMEDLAPGFRDRTNIQLSPQRVGNRVAAKLLLAGDIEFAFTCQPHDKLVRQFQLEEQQVKDWQTVRFARDPVVVVVNRQNRVTNLTKVQLTNIFAGKISNWQEVGGDDLEVKVAFQDEAITSGVLVVFQEQTVGRDKDGKLRDLSPNAVRFPGPQKRGAYIIQNPGAVTFMGLGAYRERYGHLVYIDNVAPSRENIVNGSYPLAATYYIIYNTQNNAVVAPFIDYISSAEGQAAINKNFVADIETKQ